jgi:antitoxin component of MazEF toxin-antitoxin module
MTHLVPVGQGLGVQIPPHLIRAAHLDDTSDLFFEITERGLLIVPETTSMAVKQNKNLDKSLAQLIDESPFKGVDFDFSASRTTAPEPVDFS